MNFILSDLFLYPCVSSGLVIPLSYVFLGAISKVCNVFLMAHVVSLNRQLVRTMYFCTLHQQWQSYLSKVQNDLLHVVRPWKVLVQG